MNPIGKSLKERPHARIVESGFDQHVGSEGVAGDGQRRLDDPTEPRLDGVELLLDDPTLEGYEVAHSGGEPRLAEAAGDRMQVTSDGVLVAEEEDRGGDRPGDHLGGVVEEILLVRRGAGIADDQADPAAPAGAAAPLGVIVGPGRDVPQHDRVQAADVDAHLQGRGAGQEVGG